MLDFSPDALADLFSPDAVYEFPFLAPHRETQRYDGREQIRAGFTRAWASFRPSPLTNVRDVCVHDTTDPEVIIAEEELDAVNRATGHPFTSAFLLILRARQGEIVHLRDYSDVLRTSAGLDRLPQLLDSLRTCMQPLAGGDHAHRS
jgi:ketosteroid isomerase-like protein